MAAEDHREEAARGTAPGLRGAAIRHEQRARPGAGADDARQRAGNVVGAQPAVGADEMLVLLDGAAAQRHADDAGAIADPHDGVDVAARPHVEPLQLERRGRAVPAQLREQRIDRVRQDVHRLLDVGDVAPHLAEREHALDVDERADLAQVLERQDRRPLEEALVPGADLEAGGLRLRHAAPRPRRGSG